MCFVAYRPTVFPQLQSKMEALLSSSKLFKHWPSILLGLLVALAIKYIKSYRKRPSRTSSWKHLEGEENVAGSFPMQDYL